MYQARREPRAASLSRSATCATTFISGVHAQPGSRTPGHGAWLDGRGRVVPVRGGRLAQDRWVIAPDWRGYGLTEMPWRRQLLVPRLPGRPGFPAGPLQPRCAGGPGGPQHGRQCGDAVCRGAAPAHPPAGQPGRLWHAGPGPPRRRGATRAGWTRSRRLHRGEHGAQALRRRGWRGRRLMKTNPRLTQDKADWLAPHWARPNAQGQWVILGDPAHKIVNAQLSRWTRCWNCTAASPRRCWRWRPATTAWASGGRGNTPWPSTTSG
jgi:hypothetical protein